MVTPYRSRDLCHPRLWAGPRVPGCNHRPPQLLKPSHSQPPQQQHCSHRPFGEPDKPHGAQPLVQQHPNHPRSVPFVEPPNPKPREQCYPEDPGLARADGTAKVGAVAQPDCISGGPVGHSWTEVRSEFRTPPKLLVFNTSLQTKLRTCLKAPTYSVVLLPPDACLPMVSQISNMPLSFLSEVILRR